MKVLIYGDSLTHNLHLANHDTTVETHAGSTACELRHLEEQGIGLTLSLQDDQYDVVVLMAGTNDLGNGKSVDEIVADITFLHKTCVKAQVPHIIVMSIENCDNSRLSDFPDYCEFFEYISPDMKSDHIHLNTLGQHCLREYLEDMISSF